MRIEIELFGASRTTEPLGVVRLASSDDACVGDPCRIVDEHAQQGRARYQSGTPHRCGFDGEAVVLGESNLVTDYRRFAVQMPMGGG